MYLVLGSPNPVALRVVEILAARGESVVVVGSRDGRGLVPPTVEFSVGDPSSIDLGLSGARYRELLRSVDEVILADTTYVSSGDVERNRFVRQAAEVAEFVRAGGARRGVRFLSSLLVFGNAKGEVSEDEFEVGQGFRDELEESLAVAEKIVRGIAQRCPVAILRCAPVAGDERSGELLPGAPLAHLARQISAASGDSGYAFSDLPVYFETVGTAAAALVRFEPETHLRVAHLVDRDPLTDRTLVHLLARAAEKTIHEITPGSRPWSVWTRTSYPGSRSLSGWGLQFSRDLAEQRLMDLLDTDREGNIGRFFSRSGDAP